MASSQGRSPGSLRLPVPYLFVGPGERQGASSPGASNAPSSSRIPLLRQRSTLPSNEYGQLKASDDDNLRNQDEKTAKYQQRQDDRTEAIWVEMQNTLDEIELTAANGLNNVFGPEHANALQELRNAQVRLAEAWGRSEIDEHVANGGSGNGAASSVEEANRADLGGDTSMLARDRIEKTGVDSVGSTSSEAAKPKPQPQPQPRSKILDEKTQFEEDTDNDILLARQRREANDRYFEVVNRGVLDVVNKLDEVAERMRAVENESKEIWNDKDSLESDSAD